MRTYILLPILALMVIGCNSIAGNYNVHMALISNTCAACPATNDAVWTLVDNNGIITVGIDNNPVYHDVVPAGNSYSTSYSSVSADPNCQLTFQQSATFTCGDGAMSGTLIQSVSGPSCNGAAWTTCQCVYNLTGKIAAR